MRDEEHGKMQLLLELAQHSQHLVLHRDVQRRHRFIRHDQFRRHGDGAGKAQALALAARELVRVTAAVVGVQAHALQQFADAGRAAVLRQPVRVQRLAQDLGHRHAGVEAGVRVLEHDLHAAPPRQHLLFIQRAAARGR
ncbi:hypothetical protein G6F60_014102 [Rhizopus arrhizus]|nr:hypothetical protein G6F60_014102 [Rhizopus arrhizus]